MIPGERIADWLELHDIRAEPFGKLVLIRKHDDAPADLVVLRLTDMRALMDGVVPLADIEDFVADALEQGGR